MTVRKEKGAVHPVPPTSDRHQGPLQKNPRQRNAAETGQGGRVQKVIDMLHTPLF